MTGPGRRLFSDVWALIKMRKRWWLLPILLVLLAMATFIVFAEGSVAVPLLYTLF